MTLPYMVECSWRAVSASGARILPATQEKKQCRYLAGLMSVSLLLMEMLDEPK